MDGVIQADSQSLRELTEAFATAGKDYQKKLEELGQLIEDITNGDIQGDPATQLKSKYEEKVASFNELRDALKKAEDHMNDEEAEFRDVMRKLEQDIK